MHIPMMGLRSIKSALRRVTALQPTAVKESVPLPRTRDTYRPSGENLCAIPFREVVPQVFP